jgi:hypothetical protein
MDSEYLSQKTCLIDSYWFGLSFLRNSLHPIIRLPAILLSYVPATSKNTYLVCYLFWLNLGNDSTGPFLDPSVIELESHWGRRVPFIAVGTL